MKQILDIYSGNRVDFAREKATGTDGILIKLGQGQYPDYLAKKCDFIQRTLDVGLPWGGFWQMDARYSPESTKAAIKQTLDVVGYGKLGFSLAVEFPYYPMPDFVYWTFPYCNYKNIESVWRGVYAHDNRYPDFYSSVSKWNLIMGSYTNPDPRKASRALQEEFAKLARKWAAQYGVQAPDPWGAWGSHYDWWQYTRDPDYSVMEDELYNKLVGATPEPEPEPAPYQLKSVFITVTSKEAALNAVTAVFSDDSSQDLTGISALDVVQPPEPEPEPTPNLYRVKWMFERPIDEQPDSGPYNKPDVLNGAKDSVVRLTQSLQNFWYALLNQYRPIGWTDAQMKKAWASLTADDRAFTNFSGSTTRHDYINGTNANKPDMNMDKYRACGGNVVWVLDERPVDLFFKGKVRPCLKVMAIDPTVPLDATLINYLKTPWLVHIATNDAYQKQPDGSWKPIVFGFPQLDGNWVQVPTFGVGGFNYLPVDCLEKLPNPEEIPSMFKH